MKATLQIGNEVKQADKRPPICVIHKDEDGNQSLYFTKGVLAFWVEETCPDDRVFQSSLQMTHNEIVALIGPQSNIGRSGDGSPAEARAHAAVAEIEGRKHLSVITPKDQPNDR